MVSAPAPPLPQTVTVLLDDCPVCTMNAVFVYDTHVFTGTDTLWLYVYVAAANGAESVAVTVPSVVVAPLYVSLTVIVLLVFVVGLSKSTAADPLAESSGVAAASASQLALAVLVPSAGLGAPAYVHV